MNDENHWYFLKSSDGKCQGYIPGKDVKQACSLFGYSEERCKEIREVIKTEEGFKDMPKPNEQLIMF